MRERTRDTSGTRAARKRAAQTRLEQTRPAPTRAELLRDLAAVFPVHPGEILDEEYLKPLGISQRRLARAARLPRRRIRAIVRGRADISPKVALRLARAVGTTDPFWLNLQARYDLDRAARAERELLKSIQLASGE